MEILLTATVPLEDFNLTLDGSKDGITIIGIGPRVPGGLLNPSSTEQTINSQTQYTVLALA